MCISTPYTPPPPPIPPECMMISNDDYKAVHALSYITDGQCLSFYKSWGKHFCDGCTDWCTSHCYMKIKSFVPEMRSNLFYRFYCSDFIENEQFQQDIEKAQYITFFGSGTISEPDLLEIQAFINMYPNKTYRFFVRELRFVDELFKHGLVIFSADRDTDATLLKEALKNRKASISIVEHPDNKDLIDRLQETNIANVNCNDCATNGCSKHLCFLQDDAHFLLLMAYEELIEE